MCTLALGVTVADAETVDEGRDVEGHTMGGPSVQGSGSAAITLHCTKKRACLPNHSLDYLGPKGCQMPSQKTGLVEEQPSLPNDLNLMS